MFVGEVKKIIKNRLFLMIMAAILVANVVAILYCMETKNESYYMYKQEEQQQYVESYQVFIDEMKNRGDEMIAAFDAGDESFIRRDVEKTERDYSGLSGLKLDGKYNEGVVSYAGYDYGIFFCILFAFVCLEYVYVFERRTAMLQVLRTTKKGRRQMILAKWSVYLLLLLVFSILQECMTIGLYGITHTLGDLGGPIQSIQLFRDCPGAISLGQALLATMANRVLIGLAVGSIVFLAGIAINSIAKAIVLPCALFALQYIFSVTLSVYSSYDKLCCVNIFHSWSMKNYIGLYHNLNIGGIPVEKNMVMQALCMVVILFSILVGTAIFSVRYQAGYTKYESKILKYLRKLCSLLLHRKNMFINEWYRLFFQQRKWILFAVFLMMVYNSMDQYIPKNIYQTAYEATYHMYLANIGGKVNDNTEVYISDERKYLETLKQKMDEAMAAGDDIMYMQLEAEYTGRKEAFDRLCAQYEKVLARGGKEVFLIDEMDLDTVFHKYDRDVLLFLTAAIILILMLSGLFASEKENKIKKLIVSTRNGRSRLFHSKITCSIFLATVLFVVSQIPVFRGYASILTMDCLKQKLYTLYDPEINSALSMAVLLGIIFLVKYFIQCVILILTIFMARKTKNEFVTSAFMCTVVIITCLVFYFLKWNITGIVIGMCS